MLQALRILLTAMLAASLAGCTAGLAPGVSRPGTQASPDQETGRLRIEVRPGFSIQTTFDDYKVLVTLERVRSYYYGEPEPIIASQEAAGGGALEFTGIPVGRMKVRASLKDAAGTVLDSDFQEVEVAPGGQHVVSFSFTAGGSSAFDMGITFGGMVKDWRTFDQEDGLNAAFRSYRPSYTDDLRSVVQMTLTRGAESYPVTIFFRSGSFTRQIGTVSNMWFDESAWTSLPDHAEYVDSTPMGAFKDGKYEYGKVRHFRWTNTFALSGGDRTLDVERWVSAEHGIVKETLKEGGTEVSVLKRNGLP